MSANHPAGSQGSWKDLPLTDRLRLFDVAPDGCPHLARDTIDFTKHPKVRILYGLPDTDQPKEQDYHYGVEWAGVASASLERGSLMESLEKYDGESSSRLRYATSLQPLRLLPIAFRHPLS
jgi:hypothetical protein